MAAATVWSPGTDSNATNSAKLTIARDFHLRGGDWERCGRAIGDDAELRELRLCHLWDYGGGITRERLAPLWRGVARNRSLRKLVLDKHHLFGGKAFFDAMCPFFEENGSLEALEIYSNTNDIDERGAKSLGKCLVKNTSLVSLKIYGNTTIKRGWGSVFAFLQGPHCRLTFLSLFENQIDDHAAIALAKALANNSSVKTLDLGKNVHIRGAGWTALFRVLQGPNCALEDLRLHHNRLDDSAVASLAASLSGNRSVTTLSLRGNNGWITHDWYMAFAFLFRSPGSALEKIDLSGIAIDDETVVALADSLSDNDKLKTLLIGNAHTSMGEDAISALSRLACDRSSIMATYRSNHTLQKVTGHLSHYEIQPYLDWNKVLNTKDVQRRKILETHFNAYNNGGRMNLQPFVDMDLGVLPDAVAWMVRDFWGFDLLNQFLPVLFSLLGDDWTHLSENIEAPVFSSDHRP